MERKTGTKRVDELGRDLEDDAFIRSCFWDQEQIKSVCSFVMHELHPENVHFYHYQEKDNEEISTYLLRLNPSSRFLIVLVLEDTESEHFSTYVFDLEKGRCDVLDPTFFEENTEERSYQEEIHGKVRFNALVHGYFASCSGLGSSNHLLFRNIACTQNFANVCFNSS